MEFIDTSRKKLELPLILEKIKVSSLYGREAKAQLGFFAVPEELEKEYDRIDAVVHRLEYNKITLSRLRNLLAGFKEIRTTLNRLEEGTVLAEVELYELKLFALGIRQILELLETFEGFPPDLVPPGLSGVETLLDPEGEGIPTFMIYDSYSWELKVQRRAIEEKTRELELGKRALMEELVKTYKVPIKGWGEMRIARSHEAFEKIKADPRLSYNSEGYGLVNFQVDLSYSFSGLLEEIASLKERESRIEEAVKASLSESLREAVPVFREDIQRIARLDLVLGKASFARGYHLTRPVITKENEILIEGGFNIPVLDRLRKEGMTYTPIDIILKKGTTVITGSNMGGKTVTLNLVGQAVVMAHFGLFVPAKTLRFSLRDFYYVSVGDTQDMAMGLSSFAGEMMALAKVIRRAGDRGLILVDELSRGTNPQEGYAISRSITDYLNQQEAISVFTTHFDGITPGKVHYQVKGLRDLDFDALEGRESVLKNLHQRMDYRLEAVTADRQVPKEALPISRLLGLEEEILLKAQEYLRLEHERRQQHE
ncbi:MAG: hypothetical protein AVO33_11480 [delta proteobacterium ML8_F1]|nr:MAG: hypothetical protein AVO33_11480 [delta proteobacterium ML8_F1]